MFLVHDSQITQLYRKQKSTLKPLRYFREENGYCLHSIGENASDDDGIRPGKTLEGDVVFGVGY